MSLLLEVEQELLAAGCLPHPLVHSWVSQVQWAVAEARLADCFVNPIPAALVGHLDRVFVTKSKYNDTSVNLDYYLFGLALSFWRFSAAAFQTAWRIFVTGSWSCIAGRRTTIQIQIV